MLIQLIPPLKIFLLVSVLLCSSFLCGSGLLHAANVENIPPQSLEDLRRRPVTMLEGKVGDLLRQWYAEGTAAGNVGDYYDNRDNDHSRLKIEDYPQLQKITYSKEDRILKRHYAAQQILIPHVVFGNSSTSAGLYNGGSNIRSYYTNSKGLDFLYRQYTHNNLYIYPTHRDYMSGDDGGDVFPLNSPYLIASKGSSGTDRKYMNAVAQTLAAFRPEVKERLVETGFLMPTIQMILRYAAVGSWKNYLTGKAHPTAAIRVDTLKMVEIAHKLQIDEIPPLVKLKVIEEDEPFNGEDFFSPGKSIKLADTPCAIARIFRGRSFWHRMVVSAEESIDLNGQDLSFHWKVLQGDPKEITIQPVNDSGSIVEIKIPFHEQQRITKDNKFKSNRIDIGVFVKSGKYYSAPAFITSFSLDNEARTYNEEGRILEIGYGMGKSTIAVTDWNGFFKLMAPEATSRQANILKSLFSQKDIAFMNTIADEYSKAERAINATEKELTGKEGAEKKKLKKKLNIQKKDREKLLTKRQRDKKISINKLVLHGLNNFIEDPEFLNIYHSDITYLFDAENEKNKATFTKELSRLDNFGIIKKQQDYSIDITPIRNGSESLVKRLTEYEYALIKNLNATVLSTIFFPSIVSHSFRVNFVDQRLITPKFWRDVYHYNRENELAGWIRYSEGGKTEFNRDGLIVLEKDSMGRCTKGRTVEYNQDPPERDRKGRLPFANTNPLKQHPGKEIWHYKYADDSDRQGEVVKIVKL